MKPLDSTNTARPIQERWGETWVGGFVNFPVALMRHQSALGLDAGAMVVLLNILAAWWYEGRLPFPSTHTIAARMDVSSRTVQRHLEELERLQLIRRVRGALTEFDLDVKVMRFDPSGLVEQLKALEKGEQSKAQRLAAEAAAASSAAQPAEEYAAHL
jgi:DNA-binding transcriptional regulator YhcF (GntR family)